MQVSTSLSNTAFHWLQIWMVSQARDSFKLTFKGDFTFKLTSKGGFICPFVIIDPINLGAATELLLQSCCLSIFNLSPMLNTCLFFYGNEAECVLPCTGFN